jgi:hypothetical protein
MTKKQNVNASNNKSGRKAQPNKPNNGNKSRGERGKRGSVARAACPWALSVMRPFSNSGAHIPDTQTAAAGLPTSWVDNRVTFTNNAGTTGTSHSGGYVFLPYPYYSSLTETTPGSLQLTDISSSGTANNWSTVPNISALAPTGTNLRIRCTAIGVRFSYEGTELQRSGKFGAALIPANFAGATVASTGTQVSMMSVLTNSISPTISTIIESSTKHFEARVDDGTFEVVWQPNGVPSYQIYPNSQAGSITAGGTPVLNSTAWQAVPGGGGSQSGQNALVVWVEGDITGAAATASNPYRVEARWHWEAIPNPTNNVSYEMTTSPSDSHALDACINSFSTLSMGRITKSEGTSFTAARR